MKILVTGGAGFIGSHFVDLVVREGHHPVVVDALTYAGRKANLAHLQPHQYTFIHANICDAGAMAELIQAHSFDAVFNFAAETHVDRSISKPADFVMTNVVGTSVLLNECLRDWERRGRDAKFRFVQISTDEVFGSLGKTGYFKETTPYAPNSPYSASKAGADFMVRSWFQTYGLPAVTTHCSNNYGPRQFPEKLIPAMISRALKGESLGVYGDGSNVRDWLHVEDHCQGIWSAYRQGRPGENYCFGGSNELTNLNLVHQLCDTMDKLKPRSNGSYRELIQFVTDRLGHDHRYAIDFSKAKQELDFHPRVDFSKGLKETVRWYLEQP